MNKTLFSSLLLWLIPVFSHAQPAQFFIGESGHDLFQHLVAAPDGNFFATGSRQIGSERAKVWLRKFSPDGQTIWEKTYPLQNAAMLESGFGIRFLPDGKILVTGQQRSEGFPSDRIALALLTDAEGHQIWKRSYTDVLALFDAAPVGNNYLLVGWSDEPVAGELGQLMLVNSSGALQWKQIVDVSSQTKVRRIFPTSDGKFLLLGRANVSGQGFAGVFLRKIEANGDLIWEKTHYTGWKEYSPNFSNPEYYDQPLGAAQLPDGSILMATPFGKDPDAALLHFSSAGELISSKTYGNGDWLEQPYSLQVLPDGKRLLCGEARSLGSPADAQGFAMLVAPAGLEIWRSDFGSGSSIDRLFGGAALPGGGFLLAGSSNLQAGGGTTPPDGWLLQTNAEGTLLPWKIRGRIVADLNNNCQADPGEPPVPRWILELTNTHRHSVITNDDGRFEIATDDGITQVEALAPPAQAGAWNFCQQGFSVLSNAANPDVELTFLVQSANGCPHTELGLTQPDLRRCEASSFYITVQNHGVVASDPQPVGLRLDPEFEVLASSEPFVQVGNDLIFMADAIPPFSAKTIEVQARLSCDVQWGATHAALAFLGESNCTQPWAGPFFEVEGRCAGTEVKFELKNSGSGAAAASTTYRLLADDILLADSIEIELPANAPGATLSFPADGRTWRLELQQTPGYPFPSWPSAVVEGCGTAESGLHSIAWRNTWRQDDRGPERSAALAPNTTGLANKVAESPHGFGYYNLIGDRDWLEFTARFENPLPTSAEEIAFLLTFSPTLDPQTFQALAWSATPTFRFEPDGALYVHMPHAALDTSGAGAVAYLRFRVKPLPNVPADSAQSSLFLVQAVAFADGDGPHILADGFLNYSKIFPQKTQFYNGYGPEVRLFGGRGVDFGACMAQAADGNVFLGGSSTSYSDRTYLDGFLAKVSPTGRTLWFQAIDLGDGATNNIRSIVALPDGGCMLAGNHQSKAATANYLLWFTPYIARLDAEGKMLWYKKFRPFGDAYGAFLNKMVSTPDGNLVLCGDSESPAWQDAFYRKITPDGALVWQVAEARADTVFTPELALATPDGGVVFFGEQESNLFEFSDHMEKIDAAGNIVWSHDYYPQKEHYLGGLVSAPDGGFISAGYSQWVNSPIDVVTAPSFLKFDSDGQLQWEKTPVVGPFKIARAYCATPDPAGGYFVGGEIWADTAKNTDLLLLKIDENGDPLWWKNFGARNTEWVESISLNPANRVLIWGFNQQRPPDYDIQALLVSTNLEGNVPIQSDPPAPRRKAWLAPNPAGISTWVQVLDPQARNLRWQLIRATGELATQGFSPTPGFYLDLEGLNAGVYLLRFPDTDIPVEKLVVVGR